MVSISYGIKINWSTFLYNILVAIISIPDEQYQGFVLLICRLIKRCKVQIRHSSALHIHRVLNENSIAAYKAKNNITKDDLLQVNKAASEKKKKSPGKGQVKSKLVVDSSDSDNTNTDQHKFPLIFSPFVHEKKRELETQAG